MRWAAPLSTRTPRAPAGAGGALERGGGFLPCVFGGGPPPPLRRVYAYSVSTDCESGAWRWAMVRKIFKTGNSLVVALPRDVLERLALAEGAEVTVDLDSDGRRIVIAPAERRTAGVDETFARQVAEVIEAYRPALEALAK